MVPNVVRSISMASPPHDLGTRPRLRVGRRAWHRCQGPPASRRSPDSQTAPPRVGRLRRRRATALLAPRPIPSGIGMTKPTIQQARDRAEVVSGATRPEWVASVGSVERLLTGARNGLANVKADDAVGLFELGAVDRQLSDPLARRREDRVGDRRHDRRRTRLPTTPRSLRALDQMDVDQRRLVDAQYPIVVEISLLDAAVLNRDLAEQGGRDPENYPALHLRL